MSSTPLLHVWREVPMHAGPDEWECTRCGAEKWSRGTPGPYCTPRAASIKTLPACVRSFPATETLSVDFLPPSHV